MRFLAEKEISHLLCQSKLAEVLEKILKAELIRLGWFLVKTHDVQELVEELRARANPFSFRISSRSATCWRKVISLTAILASTWTSLTGRHFVNSGSKWQKCWPR